MADMCKRSSKFSGIVQLLIGDLIRLEYYRCIILDRFFVIFKLVLSSGLTILPVFNVCVKDSR